MTPPARGQRCPPPDAPPHCCCGLGVGRPSPGAGGMGVLGRADGCKPRHPPSGGASRQGGGLSPPLLDLDNGSVWLSDCLMGVIWEKVRVLR